MEVEEFNNWIAQIAQEAGRILEHTTLHGIRPYRYPEIPSEVEFLIHWEPDGSRVLRQTIRLKVDDLRAHGAAAIVAAVRHLME